MIRCRNVLPRLARAVSVLAGISCLLGCGGNRGQAGAPPGPTTYEVFRTLPVGVSRPDWTLVPPQDERGQKFFVGVSNYHATEQESREAAMQDARSNFANFTGVDFQAISQELSVSYGLASEVVDPTQSALRKQKEEVYAQFGRLRATTWYLEQSYQKAGKKIMAQAWQAWSLVSVPEDEYDRVVTWRKEQETQAQRDVEDILADATKRREETRAMLASGRPLEALGKIEGNWKSLDARRQSLKGKGWPYDKPGYDLRIEQSQATTLDGVRDALGSIRLDTGRYSGAVYLPPRRTATTVSVWAFCESDGCQNPIASLPLALRSETGAKLARATTGANGKAEFHVAGLRSGTYAVLVDTEAPVIQTMDQGVRTVLAAKENTLSVLTPGETLPEVVLVALREIFHGPAVAPLPVSTVSLGPVTFENPNQGDTRQGGRFAQLLKDEIRDKITKMEGLSIVEPKTRSVEDFAQATEALGSLNRGAEVAPKIQSATAQALMDGAEGALESRYTVEGFDVRLAMDLKKAGTDRVLASALVIIPAGSLPPGMIVRPQPLPTYGKTQIPPITPIRIEVTSQRGDGETYAEGEDIIYFFSTDRDAYLLLIYEDAEQNLLQVLPNRYAERGFYPAGKYFQIPEDSADYSFTVTAPFGSERLWAFASSVPFPELQGEQQSAGKVLSQPMDLILALFRQHGARAGIAYGEAQTVLTTVPRSGAEGSTRPDLSLSTGFPGRADISGRPF